MILDLPSGKYRLYIRHDLHPKRSEWHFKPKAVTIAELRSPDGGDIVRTATAQCVPEDQFRKKTGVRLAVTRLIKDFPRAERALIWKRIWNLK